MKPHVADYWWKLAAATTVAVTFTLVTVRGADHHKRLQDLVGSVFDVQLCKGCDVLWGVGAESVRLVALDGARAVFEDPSGRFAAAFSERLGEEDRYRYGPKLMAERPLVLSPTTFSVMREEIAFLRASGKVVWVHPDHADYLKALERVRLAGTRR